MIMNHISRSKISNPVKSRTIYSVNPRACNYFRKPWSQKERLVMKMDVWFLLVARWRAELLTHEYTQVYDLSSAAAVNDLNASSPPHTSRIQDTNVNGTANQLNSLHDRVGQSCSYWSFKVKPPLQQPAGIHVMYSPLICSYYHEFLAHF